MPITAQHAKSITIADGTNTNIVRPSDWNSGHLITYNPTGAELFPAFSNEGNVTFSTNPGGYLVASAPTGGGGGGIGLAVAGSTATSGTVQFNNSNGVTFGMAGATVTASHNGIASTLADATYYPKTNEGTTVAPNGFPDRTQMSYSWSDATRTLTITPTGASFTVWSNGTRYVKSAPVDFVFADTEGQQYAYFDDNGDPQTTTTFSTNLILRWAITGILYWDATNNVAVPDLQREWHGTDWPPELHLQQHVTVGCRYQSGLALTLTADQDGSSAAHIEVAGAQGYIWDEDIQHNILARVVTDTLPVLYKSGASLWRYDNGSAAIVRATGTGRAAWNENVAGTWQLTEMTDGYFGVVHLCVGSGLSRQWFAVMGDAEYATLDEATTAANEAADMTGLPFPEYRVVGAIVFETSNSFTNSVKSRVRYNSDGGAWVDWRYAEANELSVSAGSGVQIVADGATYANGPVSFGNTNNFSFQTSNGSIVGSFATSNLAPVTHSHGVTLALTNLNGTTGGNSNGISLSLSAPAQTAYQFSNSNGVSFGTNGSTVTATVKTDYAGTGFTGVNATGTLNSNGLSLSIAAGGGGADGYNILAAGTQTAGTATTVAFANSNGISFGMSGSSQITASYTVPTVPTSYLSQVNGSSGAVSFAVGSSLSSSQNGSSVTFGLASNITTALQSTGNYLTTARASNDAIGLNTALTANGLSVTANSSGLSINVPAWLTTAANSTHSHGNPTLALTNLSGTTASASNGFTLSLSAAAGGGGADGYNIIGVNGNSVGSAATVQFSNANNVSFGLNGSTVTASASYPAQTVQPAVAQLNGSSGTMSFAVGSSLSASSNASTITFGLASNITTALQSAGNYLTTARASNDAIGLNTALTANGLSVTANSSGLSINVPAWLTTAANSTHSHGNPTLALTNINGTTASASNGVTFSLSAAAQSNQTGNFYASGNTTQLSSTAGLDLRSLSFEGAGIASVGVSNGRVLVSVPAGGGGGDGYNIVSLGTTGTTGTAWSSLSGSIALNGSGALTVSQNNSNQIVISAPPQSYLTGGSNITLSSGGSTISIHGQGAVPTLALTNLSGTTATNTAGFTLSLSAGAGGGGGGGVTLSGYRPYADIEHIAGQVGQGTIIFDPDVAVNVQFDRIVIPLNCSNSSNSSGSHTLSFWLGIYSQNASTLSLWGSTSTSVALTHSGTQGSYSLYSGMRILTIPWTTTLPEGNYWYANLSRTTSGGANGSYSQFILSQLATNFVGHFGSSNNTTMQYQLGQGVYTATSSGLPNSVAFSQIRGSDSAAFRAPKFHFASGTA